MREDLVQCEELISKCNNGVVSPVGRAGVGNVNCVSFHPAVRVWHCADSAFHYNVPLRPLRESREGMQHKPHYSRFSVWEKHVSTTEYKWPISLKHRLTLCVC